MELRYSCYSASWPRLQTDRNVFSYPNQRVLPTSTTSMSKMDATIGCLAVKIEALSKGLHACWAREKRGRWRENWRGINQAEVKTRTIKSRLTTSLLDLCTPGRNTTLKKTEGVDLFRVHSTYYYQYNLGPIWTLQYSKTAVSWNHSFNDHNHVIP
jgi:hypothetical protein